MLDDWREGDELRDAVFGAAATFPLQNGIESFDPQTFIERLRSSTAKPALGGTSSGPASRSPLVWT